jgi:hypothetical protein
MINEPTSASIALMILCMDLINVKMLGSEDRGRIYRFKILGWIASLINGASNLEARSACNPMNIQSSQGSDLLHAP